MNENNEKQILTKIEKKYAKLMLSKEVNEDRASVRTKWYNLY
ncbi:MAG: hypothetical protein ACTSQF_13150 [Candidatus Heimdallarchaeaceae archaeon]